MTLPLNSPIRSPLRSPLHSPMAWEWATGNNSVLDSLQYETDGLLLDFVGASGAGHAVYGLVRDSATPANNFDGDANGLLTYTAPSAKYVMNASGVLVSGSTLRCDHNAAGTPLGLLVEEARTNLALQSDDFTNASWTKSNMNTAKTATGPDGVTNSASTLTATAGNATALQAITSGNAARITSCYIKRRTGTGNIQLTQDNGGTWTTVTTTASWTRVNIASVTSTNPTVGIRIVTSGDAVDVALFQHEVGAFITSPIRTTTGTVTRAIDNIVWANTFADQLISGTLVGMGTSNAAAGLAMIVSLGSGIQTEYASIYNTDLADLSGGTGYLSVGTGLVDYTGQEQKKAISWDASSELNYADNFGVTDDTATDVADAFSDMDTLVIGNFVAGDSNYIWSGRIKYIKYLPRKASLANLQSEVVL